MNREEVLLRAGESIAKAALETIRAVEVLDSCLHRDEEANLTIHADGGGLELNGNGIISHGPGGPRGTITVESDDGRYAVDIGVHRRIITYHVTRFK